MTLKLSFPKSILDFSKRKCSDLNFITAVLCLYMWAIRKKRKRNTEIVAEMALLPFHSNDNA